LPSRLRNANLDLPARIRNWLAFAMALENHEVMNHKKSWLSSVGGVSRRQALIAGATVATSLYFGNLLPAAERRRRVVVWSEGTAPDDKVYPKDVNTAMADGLKKHIRDWIYRDGGRP
jgi:hypothetical protein